MDYIGESNGIIKENRIHWTGWDLGNEVAVSFLLTFLGFPLRGFSETFLYITHYIVNFPREPCIGSLFLWVMSGRTTVHPSTPNS